jgi:hypothetical protein
VGKKKGKKRPDPEVLRQLQQQRIAFGEPSTTSVHTFFSIFEPESSYFTVRKWVQGGIQTAYVTNLFQPFSTRVTREQRSHSLSPSGSRMLGTPNAGGSSLWSEVMSLELLQALYGAILLRTEMEILYGCGSKITDYSVQMMGHHFGVSVTRAMKFQGIFTSDDAQRLLEKKLNGVERSSRGVVREHRWEKQILHVWAECDYVAELVQRTFEGLEEEVKADTLVVCSVGREAPWMF